MSQLDPSYWSCSISISLDHNSNESLTPMTARMDRLYVHELYSPSHCSLTICHKSCSTLSLSRARARVDKSPNEALAMEHTPCCGPWDRRSGPSLILSLCLSSCAKPQSSTADHNGLHFTPRSISASPCVRLSAAGRLLSLRHGRSKTAAGHDQEQRLPTAERKVNITSLPLRLRRSPLTTHFTGPHPSASVLRGKPPT
ncbi:hypothetical protein BKA80DRAFT_71958 [Phyllosticta citrichinensis]